MTNEYTPHAQAVSAQLRRERDNWIPIPPKILADPSKNHKRGTPKRRKVRTIL